jgi:threonine/homoserine/homoserine lactone efflux protein
VVVACQGRRPATRQVIAYLIQGIGYGFMAAVQPGPFQTYIISRTLTGGWKRTLPLIAAPLLSDGPIILVALLLLTRIPDWLQQALYLVSGVLILYLAHGAYRGWRRGAAAPTAPAAAHPDRYALWHAAAMNASSPGPYVYWNLITGPILVAGWHQAPTHALGFLTGFYLAMAVSLCTIILVFGKARQLGPRLTHALLGISVIGLAGFGVHQLVRGISMH